MTESFHLYITESKIYVRRQVGIHFFARVELVGDCDWNAAQLSTLSLARFNFPDKCRIYAYIGSSLCRFMVVSLPEELTRASEQNTAAQAVMQLQLGLVPADWIVTLDSTETPNKPIACAVRHSLFNRLLEVLDAGRCRLISMRPVMAGVWNCFQAASRKSNTSALILFEREAFTVLVQRLGVLNSIHALSCPLDAALIDREVQRLNFSLNGDQSVNYYLAIENNVTTSASVHKNKILHQVGYLKKNTYADFRDLFFHSDVKNT